MALFNHTQCLQVGPGASSLALASGQFDGALGMPKAGQGARLGLSGTTYVNDVCSWKVSCLRLVLTPKPFLWLFTLHSQIPGSSGPKSERDQAAV